jgi:nicotinamide riboside kinase
LREGVTDVTARPLSVCLTGSECTGKTTLAAVLAERYGTAWVPEASRAYAEKKASPLDASDVEPIARLHIALAEDAEARASGLLILDTDLLSTVVYARHYYGGCPEWIERAARERLADLYLLHIPDVPWFPDPARDRGHLRAEMHGLFAEVLEDCGAVVTVIRGGWADRERRAVTAVDELQRAFKEAG